jgi:dihydropteroate synthase
MGGRARAGAGATVVNDIPAPAIRRWLVVRAAHAGLVLMHMKARQPTCSDPRYEDAAGDPGLAGGVAAPFMQGSTRIDRARSRNRLRKRSMQSGLLAGLDRLAALGRPVVVGVSRKSFLGKLLDDAPVDQRLEGGLAAAAVAVFRGASVVRTHDVAATVRAVRLAAAIRSHS